MTEEGNTGEIPVKIISGRAAEIVSGFAEDVDLDSYNVKTDDNLRMGDVCIFVCEITDVDGPFSKSISVDVYGVQFIRREDQEEQTTKRMMQHLEKARQNRDIKKDGCENCSTIDSSTGLSATDDHYNRDLHYCAQCGRLLSAEEYQRWRRRN